MAQLKIKNLELDTFDVQKMDANEMKESNGGVAIVGSAAGMLLSIAVVYLPVVVASGLVAAAGGAFYAIYKAVKR